MNTTKNIALFGVIAIAVGIIGVTQVSANTFSVSDSPKTTENGSFLGHVTLIVTDPQGNIKAYRQSDNIVVNQGRNCAPQVLFGVPNTDAACNSAVTGTFDVIAVSSSNTAITNNTITALASELSGSGLTRAAGTASVTTAASGAGGSSSVTTITKTFTYTGGSAQSVGSAGLYDGSGTPKLFAARAFASAVSLNTNDQLTVNWSMTLA